MYQTPFLRQVNLGVLNTLPSGADRRKPLLLPELMTANGFRQPKSDQERIFRFGVILGFVGMLRPHAFNQIHPSAITIVTQGGQCTRMPKQTGKFRAKLNWLRRNTLILGYFIQYQSKTMAKAIAYFPSLCSKTKTTQFATMCPVRALVEITRKSLMRNSLLSSINRGQKFTKYLQELNGISSSIAPYALRIGGRTWLISNGLDRQFVDYLGTWKSHEASARYYRGAPRAVLHMLRKFYLTLPSGDIVQ